MSTTLYLVRHGATPANLENRFAGRTGEKLHALGTEQIHRLGNRLGMAGIARIFASPLPRTMQSASILSRMVSAGVVPDPDLTEIHIPHWDGLTKEEIRERFGPEYPLWIKTPHRFALDGCETIAQVQTRAVRAVQRIVAVHPGENCLIVSHLIVLRSLLLYFQQLPISAFRSIKINNGSITTLVFNRQGVGVRPDYP
ncbi:MAG: histidine phosphatase family protein [Desulfobacterales bacterium]|nr:histidine phosphatase family protein [Desulfobacterales bacterium]